MQFDFYRAYSAATATRSAKALDAAGNVMLGDDGRPFKAPVAEWPVEDVAFEGDADENRAVFDAGDTVITRVVFYIGDAESARVMGQVEVGKPGKIDVACPDAE